MFSTPLFIYSQYIGISTIHDGTNRESRTFVQLSCVFVVYHLITTASLLEGQATTIDARFFLMNQILLGGLLLVIFDLSVVEVYFL